MITTGAQIIEIMEALAPSRLAEDWDNAGLQIGRVDRPVRSVMVALDPSFDVVTEACEKKIDLLITHHPFLIRPLKSIDLSTPIGLVIKNAINHGLTIYSAHTNLDIAANGVNDVLTEKIGLVDVRALSDPKSVENCKLVVFIPVEYEHQILEALFQLDAGKIGDYSCCSFRNKGTGTYLPGDATRPFAGKAGEIFNAEEIRVEIIVPQKDVSDVVARIHAVHPYETMAYDVYPLLSTESSGEGLGRVGEIEKEMAFSRLAAEVKQKLGLSYIRTAGRPDLRVKKVAVCSGSGSSIMKRFFDSGAQVYISGDLRYHDAKDTEAMDRGLIDIGHFASEHLIVKKLSHMLQTRFKEEGMDVKIEIYENEKDPFTIL